MSRSFISKPTRGQTEPLAALIAVSSVALALSLYGVGILQVLDDDTQRDVQERAIDTIWDDIENGGAYDRSSNLVDSIKRGESIPQGYNTRVEVVRLTDEGETITIDSVQFNADGTVINDPSGSPPESVQNATRPIPIRQSPGVVRMGTLRVMVWDR